MAFIDKTYFYSDISIPSEILKISDYTPVIDRYEPEVLKKLLGYDLHKALLADLVAGIPQEQRFKDLIDGAEFSFDYCGETINTKWEGVVNTQKISLIANYVYFNDRNENEQFYSNYGQAQSLSENSEKVDVAPKLIRIWNKMIDLYGWTNWRTDEYYFLRNTNYDHFNIAPSAYNFLLANLSDYPEWRFTPLEYMNIFGI